MTSFQSRANVRMLFSIAKSLQRDLHLPRKTHSMADNEKGHRTIQESRLSYMSLGV